MTTKNRFESKFFKTAHGCWNWSASLRSGYGAFKFQGFIISAHRFSYELYVGKIPEGLFVLHKCNNRKCVNPEHLYLGISYNNVQDSVKAGTHYKMITSLKSCAKGKSKGQDCPSAKLHNEDVICIKKMLRDGIKQWLIAYIYQVTISAISHISTGVTWKSVRI